MEWVNGLNAWIDDRWNRAPVSGPRKSANKSTGSIGLQCSGSCVCWQMFIFKDIPLKEDVEMGTVKEGAPEYLVAVKKEVPDAEMKDSSPEFADCLSLEERVAPRSCASASVEAPAAAALLLPEDASAILDEWGYDQLRE